MKKRNVLSLIVAVAMLVTCFATAPALAKSKKVKKGPALVKSVITKYYNEDTKKWRNNNKKVYTYKKGYPTMIKTMYYGSTSIEEAMYKYKIKGKKAKSMTMKNSLKVKMESAKYGKGLKVKSTWKSYDKTSYGKNTYKWKKGFITRNVDNNTNKQSEGWYNRIYTCDYKYKFKKGLPIRCEGTYKYIYGYKGKEKSKGESSRKFITEFGKAGIIKSKSYMYNDEKESTQIYKYIVKFKKGRVASITTYRKYYDYNDKKSWKPNSRCIFKYDNKKISKQRYSNMVNSIISDASYYYDYDDDYYGTFSWF